ncbi:MAG: PDZ domain-containing protein [Verrucomicrobiota bacterium]
MKRSLAITLLFIGLIVLIFWITSLELGESDEAASDLLSQPIAKPEQLLEEPTSATQAAEEPARPVRPLLLTSQNETRERLVEEVQQSAARAIASLVRVMIYWKTAEGVWQQDMVNAVCVDGDGLYATSWARVARGEVFRIQHQDGSFSECRLDSFDPTTGVALLQSSDPIQSKPAVFASGLSVPFGTALQFIWLDQNNQPQAARGHLSGVGYHSLAGFPEVISGYLLPDISVNEHQEGGMLIDLQGRMAGMLIHAPDRAAAESTAMLSVEDILHVCRHLKQLGYAARSDFGILAQKLTPDLAAGFGWNAVSRGVLVTRLQPGLPGDLAGIREGDLIVELNGRKVTGAGFFQSVLSRWPENKPLVLSVRRGDETRQLELTGVVQPEVAAAEQDAGVPEAVPAVRNADPATALTGSVRAVMVAGQRGNYFVVEGVDPRQLLFSPPLQAGDIVVRLAAAASEPERAGEVPALSETELRAQILNAERTVLLCYRNGRYFWTSVRPLADGVLVVQ